MSDETMHRLSTIGTVFLLSAGLGAVRGLADEGFHLDMDSIVFEVLETDVDTDSAKFQEYRDLGSGFNLTRLRLNGASQDGNRTLAIRADRVGRDDARYTFDYGLAGSYALSIDYNKIPHSFGNTGTLLWNRTGPGSWEIADPVQAQIQGAVLEQFEAGISNEFLADLVAPHLAAADRIDLAIQRDRTRVAFDLGKMGRLAWAAEYRHENRKGLRPYGGTFGFFNVTEIPEPIDYDTTDAEVAGEWNGASGGFRFGYRYSTFENAVSTMVWDNPFVAVDGTNPVAYLGPNRSPVSGSRGFADLAADNEANLFFASGRARLGGDWWVNGTLNYNVMSQDDPLLPYTLNTAIVGIDPATGATFIAADRSTLPVQQADTEVEVLSFAGNAGTRLGEDWKLTFRYRYYDYDTTSPRIEFPGYVRMHAVWEEVPRITVPYAYTKDDLGVELGWDATDTTTLALSYRLLSWDREFREVDSSDEDIFELSLDSRPSDKVSLRASWETGERSIDGYAVEAQLVSFLDPEGTDNQPGLRKFAQAARDFDDYDVSLQLFPSGAWNLTLGISGRDEEYPEGEFGLLSDDIVQANFEIAYTPGADLNCYLFGHVADREVLQRARQSGGTLSTSPLDTWEAAFDEALDTWGFGLRSDRARWRWDVSARWSSSDGEADFTTPPGGTPDTAVDFDNYEDIELLAFDLRLDYEIRENASFGLFYLYEDYTIDSFILQGLQPYISSAFLLAAENGDYEASVLGVNLQFAF